MGGNASREQGSTTSVTGVDPLQQDYLRHLYNEALGNVSGAAIQDGSGRFYEGKLGFFPGATVAGQGGDTLNAYDRTRGLVNAGGGATGNAGENYTQQVLGGGYIAGNANPFGAGAGSGAFAAGDRDPTAQGSNPFLAEMFANASKGVTDAFNRGVVPSIQSRFARAGGSLSAGRTAALSGAQDQLGDDLRRLGADFYGGQYNNDQNRRQGAYQFQRGGEQADEQFTRLGQERSFQGERDRQERARDFAPQYQQDELTRIGALRDVGADDRNFRQTVLNDDIERFEFNRDEAFTRLGRFAELIGRPNNVNTSRSKTDNASGGGGIFNF